MLLVLNAFNEEVFFDEHIKWKKQIWNQIKYKNTQKANYAIYTVPTTDWIKWVAMLSKGQLIL